MYHNYWACALEPWNHNYWACVPQLLKPAHLQPMLHSKRRDHQEKPTLQLEGGPGVLQLEKACLAMKTQLNQK